MINMAFMPLYMWEMWDVTPVTHTRTHEQWKVEQYSVWTESAILWPKSSVWISGLNPLPSSWLGGNWYFHTFSKSGSAAEVKYEFERKRSKGANPLSTIKSPPSSPPGRWMNGKLIPLYGVGYSPIWPAAGSGIKKYGRNTKWLIKQCFEFRVHMCPEDLSNKKIPIIFLKSKLTELLKPFQKSKS